MGLAYPHLAARIFGRPLAVAPGYLSVALEGIGPRLLDGERLPEPAGMRALKVARTSRHAEQIGPLSSAATRTGTRLAVIPLHGALSRRGGMDAASNELRSYDSVRQDLRSALADESVGGVLLDVDSPGGEVAGLPELAAEILAARGSKPVYALANTDACSAAYWLASGAERVFVTPSGSVGSIGVVAAHVDQSARDAQSGVRWTFVHAGAKKVDGHSHAPLTPSVHAEIQAEVDRLHGEFVAHVASARGLDAARVRGTEAAVMSADEALRAGLVDQVGTFDDAVNALAARVAQGPTNSTKRANARGVRMDGENLSPEVAALLAKRDADNAALSARLEAAEATLSAFKKAEDERTAKAQAEAIESLKRDACAAGSPVAESDLDKVRAAFARGDAPTALVLADAFRTRAQALGGGAVRGETEIVRIGAGGANDDSDDAKDMESFRARWNRIGKGA